MSKVSTRLQEDLLILLSFNDEYAKVIRNTVEADLFEGFYSQVVERIYSYVDQYGKAPADNLPTLFDDKLESGKKAEERLYTELLTDLFDSRETVVNPAFTYGRITEFIRHQELKSGIIEAAEILQRGGDASLEEAEEVLTTHLKKRVELFDSGIRFDNITKALRFLELEERSFLTGIKALDHWDLGPVRGGLHLLIALPKRGKTQWMTHMGKYSLLQRLKVVHVSLEMDENKMSGRYMQALFGVAKRSEDSFYSEFEFDNMGRIQDVTTGTFRPDLAYDNPKIKKELESRLELWGPRLKNLRLKSFPSGTLSVRGLNAYLDSLENREGFVPDVILLDYADIMKLQGSGDLREKLGRTYVDLRGVAGERNAALVTVSQSNRAGLQANQIDEGNISEDFSKIAHCDVALTYNQTQMEKALKLARLYVAVGRNDADKMTFAITQNYDVGQFCGQSAKINNNYFELVEDRAGPLE